MELEAVKNLKINKLIFFMRDCSIWPAEKRKNIKEKVLATVFNKFSNKVFFKMFEKLLNRCENTILVD